MGGDGWMEIDPSGSEVADAPPIPSFLEVGEVGRAYYEAMAALPQARMWGPGTWLVLHTALPLVERYLTRPGSESFKALDSSLRSALRLTEDDLQRARVRVRRAQAAQGEAPTTTPAGGVTDIGSRRSRLTQGA